MELLQLRDVKKYFRVQRSMVKAVDGVNLAIAAGGTMGLVGESGCGKSTLGRLILGLNPLSDGSIHFRGEDIHKMSRVNRHAYHRKVQMIFQDPYASLDPRMTVENIVGEGLDIHGLSERNERRERIADLIRRVGLQSDHLSRYPHEFSGGQRQRIGIARALAVRPEMVIADEPISALDISIQAQVMELLQSLQAELGLTYLFISHDLSMVEYISDYVAVMYLGRIVEYGTRDEIYHFPQHPYTQALLSAAPILGKQVNRVRMVGDVPSPTRIPTGCRFHTRCPLAMDICREVDPVLQGADNHTVACHVVNAS